MIKNYIKTSLRFFRRQKGYAIINMLGLAVGLACAFFALLWMQDELRHDRFHADIDQLYSVKRHITYSDGSIQTGRSITRPAAAALEAQFAEIEHAELVSWQQESVLVRGDQSFRQEGYWVDEAFFKIFSFPLVAGDPATVLNQPDAIVISERVAENFFGADWQADEVIGQAIRLDDRKDFQITGIAEPVPTYSTFQFDWVGSSSDYYERNTWTEDWGNSGMQMFVRLTPSADLGAVNAKIQNIIMDNHEDATPTEVFLQSYGDHYLYNDFENGQQVGGRIEYVRIFGIVALFIVLIACINFMNLATARSAQRAREIGVRKALGASRGRLIGQFMSEAVLTALGAFALAALVVLIALPAFSEIAGKEVVLTSLGTEMWVLFFAVALGAGFLAGSYPALVLSGFDPASVLRGGGVSPGSTFLRKSLVVFQFAASILLIVGTFVVYQQINYIQTKNIGLDRDNVITMTLEGELPSQYDTFKQELLTQQGIVGVSASNFVPFSIGNTTISPAWEGKDPESEIPFHVIQAQYDFIETMRMEMAAGRPYSRAFGADTSNFVINETAARVMGMDDPIGQGLSMWGMEGQIVGVVKDFHNASLYEPIEPTILVLDAETSNARLLAVRTAPGQTSEALDGLQKSFAKFSPGIPFTYQFLDERYGEMYENEQRIGTLANLFAAVAAFIACLGLFGLAAFAAERRRKEIGVRKVLGASVQSVVGLLSAEFVMLVVVACALALPLAWYGAERWLSKFTFHLHLGVLPFALAGGVALLLAVLTVGVQAYRAASANPVTSLRSE